MLTAINNTMRINKKASKTRKVLYKESKTRKVLIHLYYDC